jgi:hypothetical protein
MSKGIMEQTSALVQLNLSRLEIVNNHPVLRRTWRRRAAIAIRRNGWWW